MQTSTWIAVVVIILVLAALFMLISYFISEGIKQEKFIDLSECKNLDQKLRKVMGELYLLEDIDIMNIAIYGPNLEINTDKIESKDLVNAKMVKIQFYYK